MVGSGVTDVVVFPLAAAEKAAREESLLLRADGERAFAATVDAVAEEFERDAVEST